MNIKQYKAIKSAKKLAAQKAKEEYEEQLRLEMAKKELITAHTDFVMLEKLIQHVNNNPELKVVIHLLDGTNIDIKTVRTETAKESQLDWIDDKAFEMF